MSANEFVLTSLWEGLPMSLWSQCIWKNCVLLVMSLAIEMLLKIVKNGFVCNNADEFAEKIKYIESNDCSVND